MNPSDQATILAAHIQANATILSGLLSISSAVAAVIAAYILYMSAVEDRFARQRQDEAAKAGRRVILAQSFTAEITSLQAFLLTNDVEATLRRNGKTGERWYFHPGHEWLKTYKHDPTIMGVFGGALPAELTSYYCMMLNELGRLTWLHGLSEAEFNALGGGPYKRELLNSANTLAELFKNGNTLLKTLAREGLETDPPRRLWGLDVRSNSGLAA